MNTDILCETCEFARIDDETGDLICDALLDEDEMVDFMSNNKGGCKYYRLYDEYKTVRKQN
ncbi:MAG: hypothetical protein IKZ05_00615 [Clostridia bacterium]|nr:hypothetical protein [Clostridia bacterium]